MKGVLLVTEKVIGLFYDVHLPTAVQAIAQLVRDPTFGMQHVDMVTNSIDIDKVVSSVDRVMNIKSCSDSVVELLKRGEYVCELGRIYFDRTSKRIVGAAMLGLCVTPPDATSVIRAPRPSFPFRTRVKLFLGLLTEKSAASQKRSSDY
jgi:hypothetical protein